MGLPVDPAEPPLGFDWPELQRLLEDRAERADELRDVGAELNRLNNGGIREAAEEDKRELAEKLRKGEQDIQDQDRRTREAKKALADATLRRSGLIAAARLVEDEIAALVGAEASRWLTEVRAREKKVSKRLTDSALKLRDAHEELAAVRRLGRWLADPSARTKPGFTPPLEVYVGYDLPNGDPATMGTAAFVAMLLAQETEASL